MKTDLYPAYRTTAAPARLWDAWLTPAEHAAHFLCLLAGWAAPRRTG